MKIEKYAGIDIGSNGIRMLIMNVYKFNGNIEFNKNQLVRAPIRLGSDSFVRNEISPDTIERLCQAMISFSHLMQVYQVTHYRACATSALREAENAQEVIDIIAEKSGINIDLIDGNQEADIIFKYSIAHLLELGKNYLFIDVGGGSTELTYFENKKKIQAQSFKIGSVRSLKNLVSMSEWKRLEEFITKLKINNKTTAVGTGGNINSMLSRLGKDNKKILKYNNLVSELNQMQGMTVDERIFYYKFNPDRADVIVPALKIYTKVMKLAGLNEIYIPKMGLSDGIIKELYFQNHSKPK
ncbi:MAG: exopolyphosphatase [Chitinophagales bacterium]|jgi:exopolyphosphatase/guanosine-5'-triphosphate,3'-diphosphate pyrophosphatase|nr:exopolyphosphatase [Chitinophagales bacterium]